MAGTHRARLHIPAISERLVITLPREVVDRYTVYRRRFLEDGNQELLSLRNHRSLDRYLQFDP